MATVLLTGASGFIGTHLRKKLEDTGVTVLTYGRTDTPRTLHRHIKAADFVFHLAAVMRPDDEKAFTAVNQDLTAHILEYIVKSGKKTPLLLTSSVQATQDNAYGKSKKAAEDIVRAWSKKHGIPSYIFRLPNVFGPGAKPNSTSVVATFCHNIARVIDIVIHDPGREITFAYVDTVVANLYDAFMGRAEANADGFYEIAPAFRLSLGELAATLYNFKQSHPADTPAEANAPPGSYLYKTYVSYLPD